MTLEEAEEFFYVGTSYTQHAAGLHGHNSRSCNPEMNDLMELLRSTAKRAAALEFELESERRGYEMKTAAILEGERRQFHHETFQTMLELMATRSLTLNTESPDTVVVARARSIADLAYPAPPKGEL